MFLQLLNEHWAEAITLTVGRPVSMQHGRGRGRVTMHIPAYVPLGNGK